MIDFHEILDRAAGEVSLWEKWKREGRQLPREKRIMLDAIRGKLILFAKNLDEWCETHGEDDEMRGLSKSLRRKAKSIKT